MNMFVGPSYQLADTKAEMQRAVNLHLLNIEADGKARFVLASIPGLTLFSNQSFFGVTRGMIEVRGRCFIVVASAVLELLSNGAVTNCGFLSTTSGVVSLAYGLTQLVIVDGSGGGYVLDLASNVVTPITDPAFYGSRRVRYLNARFLFIRPDTQQFYWSAIDDATTYDPLDFASAESLPDNIVSLEVDHDEAWLFGALSVEVFSKSSGDSAFAKNPAASLEVGCVSPHCVIKSDNGIFWIGCDQNGTGIVFRAQGYTPQRVSTHAVEQALKSSTDLSQATTYSYQDGGLTFVAFNAPGLLATWVYELATGSWHERCDLDFVGQYQTHRALNHVYVFGKHLVGSSNGYIYQLSKTAYTNYLDPLVRERTSPHGALPGRVRQFFSRFWTDCTTGEVSVSAYVELSWLDWKPGSTWSNPVLRSIGLIGERFAKLVWRRLGYSEDRVWKIKFSGNAPFTLNDAGADAEPGTD